ncbi:hypothetical protein D9M68_463370 [compost metagenome]
MGKYSNSNFGDISGKVGNAVGSKWRSIKYVRALGAKSNRPPSTTQLAAQARLKLAVMHLRPIKDLLNTGFGDKKLNKISGYNAAVKAFLTNAITGTYPNYSVDYSKVQLSNGPLSPLSNVICGLNAPALNISWLSVPNRFNAFADDEVVALVYNETAKVYLIEDSTLRADQMLSLNTTAAPGDILHIWLFAISRDEQSVSPSQYAGQLTYAA